MKITINGENIGFELDKETTLDEVLVSIENWLAKFRAAIGDLVVNDSLVEDDWDELKIISIDSISTIDITTLDYDNLILQNGYDVIKYLDKFVKKVDAADSEIVGEDAIEGLKWMTSSIKLNNALNGAIKIDPGNKRGGVFVSMLKLEKNIFNLEKIENQAEKLEFFVESMSAIIKKLFVDVKEIFIEFESIIITADNIVDKIDAVFEKSEEIEQRIDDLSTDLQTSEEVKAMSTINDTVSLIEDVFRIIAFAKEELNININDIVVEDGNVEVWIEKFKQIGMEIIDAFDNKDAVLIGDLFEYEVKDRLDEAKKILTELMGKI